MHCPDCGSDNVTLEEHQEGHYICNDCACFWDDEYAFKRWYEQLQICGEVNMCIECGECFFKGDY